MGGVGGAVGLRLSQVGRANSGRRRGNAADEVLGRAHLAIHAHLLSVHTPLQEAEDGHHHNVADPHGHYYSESSEEEETDEEEYTTEEESSEGEEGESEFEGSEEEDAW